MPKLTKVEMQQENDRLNHLLKQAINEETKSQYRYLLILKRDHTYVIGALSRKHTIFYVQMRYNTSCVIELGIHEFFVYTFYLQAGNVKYLD